MTKNIKMPSQYEVDEDDNPLFVDISLPRNLNLNPINKALGKDTVIFPLTIIMDQSVIYLQTTHWSWRYLRQEMDEEIASRGPYCHGKVHWSKVYRITDF